MTETSCELVDNMTLDDGAWKDSFDKLLGPRPILRQLNILKKNVRASLNMNSSVENCSGDNSKDINNVSISPLLLSVPKSRPAQLYGKNKNKRAASISTPIGKQLMINNPFKCSLSPICDWKLRYCGNAEKSREDRVVAVNDFLSTPINPEIIIADYEAESLKENNIIKPSTYSEKDIIEQNEKNNELKPKSKPKRKTSNRHVFFTTIVEYEKNKIDNLKQKVSRKRSAPTISRKKSSVSEKSNERPSSLTLQPGKNKNKRAASISTPIGKQLSKEETAANVNDFLSAPINPEIIIADYEAEALKENNIIKPSTDSEKGIIEQNEKNRELKPKSKPKRKTSSRHVLFETIDEDEKNKIDNMKQKVSRKLSAPTVSEKSNERPSSLTLQSGKWRKTLNVWRRTHNLDAVNRKSSDVRFSKHNESVIIECIAPVGNRKSVFFIPDKELSRSATNNCVDKSEWRKRVLKCCNQDDIYNFKNSYTQNQLKNCKKIGEGAYGEVFLNSLNEDPSQNTVLKVIPIEGQELINDEMQKTFEQILPEIVITVQLGELSNMMESSNATGGFIGVKKVACVKGTYPEQMIRLWEEYDEIKGSENDHPRVFNDEQLFVVLELSYGGNDLESFVFNNAEQSYYALQQIILTLAVGEESFQFEHRDLHWGNILLLNTAEKSITYKLQGNTLTIPTKGVKTTIIDYTLSRMMFKDSCFYNDLSTDEELFSATGDYQFDIYRMMRDALKNNWEQFEPKTNVFWISYLNKKMLQGVIYKNVRSKTHSTNMSKLKRLDKIVLDFRSAKDCAEYLRKQ